MQAFAVVINLVLNLHYIPIYSWRGAAWVTLATDGTLAALMWIALLFLLHKGVRRSTHEDSVMPALPTDEI